MTDIVEQLLSAFQVEHKEHLEGIRAFLAEVERRGGAVTGADVDEAFRRAHSLKAAARVCDLGPLEALGQRLETLFGRVQQETLPLDGEVNRVIHSVLDAIEHWAACLAEKQPLPDLGGTLRAMDEVLGTPATKPPRPAPATERDDIGDQLMAAFQIEHKEHLEGIRSILAHIEKGDTDSAGNVDEAFRHAHSLKGAARLTGLHHEETIAHRLEALFSRAREGTLALGADVVRAIHLGLDAIEDGAACLLEKRPPPDPTRALEAIERVFNTEPAARQAAVLPVPAGPAPAPTAAPGVSAPRPVFQAVETVRVSADNLDRLLRSTGQLLAESQRQNLVARDLADLNRQLQDMEKEWESVRGVAAASLRHLAETPAFGRVARYLNLIEHQVRALSRQARAVRRLHRRSAWTLRLLGGQLQQDVRRVRMVSAESVFQGFRKMMRDLAQAEGKEIDFRVSGFEIQADRMVLQALKDPLMHVLCNAVSHGIELPEERRSRGKNVVGRVTLHLEAPGNRLKVVVEDDGRGIDHLKVAEVAVQRGLLTTAEAAASSTEELARLVFKPGFSTSPAVTGLSGRGMGLSVVYEAVSRLQGEVDLRPSEGAGTGLVLSVPLSVSSQRLLLVSCRSQTFAVPLHGIDRLLRVKLQEVETVEGKAVFILQGQPVPLLSLAYLLNMGEADVTVAGDTVALTILRSGTKRMAVAVDTFLGERDALIKDLDGPAAQVSKLAGGIFLEDGSICLVLNLAELIRGSRPSDRAPVLKKAGPVPERTLRSTVLVVDDSLTTRTLEKSILEAHGYQVRIAMDGVEALSQLRTEKPDLVITDIQMPRMDGFTLLEEMKRDARLAKIPVIVVTSMEKREDQERGLALGADAYIVKRKFDHQDLLDTIRQII